VIRCGGVPLAIIALACVLRDKERIEEWQAIRENCSLDIGDAQDGIFARLRLSYFYMAPHLKPCFAMCSLFPKGYKIGKEQLIDQWIAHGMVAVLDGVGYLEYTAEKYFNSLVQMSFLQDLDDENGIVTCRMHDLVHDLARSILDNEISVGVAKATTNFKKSYRYFNLIKEPPKLMPKNLFEKARAIYVAGFDNSIIGNGEAWRNSKHLRSLTVNATMDNGLTVNDATNNVSTQSLFTAILQMKNMKYLELVKLNCKALPEAISDIWSLQALHLTFSCLVELPKSLGKLQKLRVLNLSHCRSLKCLPDSIGECHMISRIDLSQCIELTVLPNSIGRNEKLRVLRLGNTKIERLPSSIPTLRNMECLDLHGCYQLVELPQGIGNLEKLHVLSLKGCTKLGGMPAGIGRLSQLQKLGLFVVGEGEKFARISELANTRIGEELIIRGISHEMDPNDAHIACLKEKTNLQRLDLQWRKYDGGAVKSKLEQVVHALDGLEPPRGIRSLKIRGYSGRQYALWMNDLAGGRVQGLPYFSLLREMRLYDLPNLKHLHGLVELPCLEELRLELMPSLESISGGPFPSLVKLQMRSLPRLGAVWMVAEKGGGCSNCTPHLEQVRVGSRISYLDIFDCHELNVKPYLPSSLHHLWLSGSEQLLQGSSLSPSLSNLKKLELQGMRGLGSGHGWELLQHMTALESLKIWDSYELTQLPESLGSLTSLRSLQVVSCPAIRALPESLGELQSLQVLNIEGCNNLSSLPQSMGHLTSLQVLQVETCNVLGQLPDCLWNLRSLRSILIIELPKLTHLPQSMCRLTSLEQFMISNCPGIKSLPEGIKGLTTLRRLSIVGCPDLARQCERRKGEDWHLISHIPCLRIS
jgi:Leucine-rich repeat (LRR) protein